VPANGQLPEQWTVGALWQQLTGCGSELHTTTNLPARPPARPPFTFFSMHAALTTDTSDAATRGPQNTINLFSPPAR